MVQLAVTAIGRDRPGIVGAITGVLVAHGLNVADTQMGLLGGRFSMTLIADLPPDADRGLVEEDLRRIADDLGLDAVAMHDLGGEARGGLPDPTHMVSVYGVDRPGIVHGVATELARQGVGITDLNTRRVDEDGGPPLYAMMLEIAAPEALADGALAGALDRVAADLDLDVVVRRLGSAGDDLD